MPTSRNIIIALCLLLAVICSGCSLLPTRAGGSNLPPILAQDELIRPYVQLGRVQITREVYGIIDPEIKPDLIEWGHSGIRAEAEKMGADAVILPEVSGTTTNYLIVPTTEYRATGIAIKFK
ncbi:hypothetical protein [Pelotalea chapellei]|uniref:CN hydrolase domain-containing protein n=1 Tax=Pelotalea chapellei TaxID=44671 RepID=A0ABS5U635_9BACT|nr:hypothetical protein [Pelotalea chapellei]MBT1071129.1 hypothetical protein [Pelotalea chapellei]